MTADSPSTLAAGWELRVAAVVQGRIGAVGGEAVGANTIHVILFVTSDMEGRMDDDLLNVN